MDFSIRKKCERCIHREARGHCVECMENICTSCIDVHERMIKSHTILDLHEYDTFKTRGKLYIDANEICREHGKRIEFYCIEHDDLGCIACMICDHRECASECLYICQKLKDDAYEWRKKPLSQDTRSILHRFFENETTKGEDYEQRVRKMQQNVEDATTKAVDDINKMKTNDMQETNEEEEKSEDFEQQAKKMQYTMEDAITKDIEDFKTKTKHVMQEIQDEQEKSEDFEQHAKKMEDAITKGIEDINKKMEHVMQETQEEELEKRTVSNEFDALVCSWTITDVESLIREGKLPTQRTLDEMCQVLGKKSKVISITCKAICEHIKSMHDDIVHVWASYTPQNQERIIFVINMKEETITKPDTKSLQINKIEYSFVKRYFAEFNQESYDIKKQQDSFEWLDEDAYKAVSNSISKYSRCLMKKHKYLSVISACPYRSKRVDGSSWKLLPESCIILYVLAKGYIPIDENPFEKTYEDIPIDVREGVFVPFGRTARDVLNPITMGCQIRGEINNNQYTEGTLGCFIDHPQFGCCGLTCAHVLLSACEMQQLKTIHGGALKWPLDDMSKNIYQPADTSQSSSIGHTVQLIFKEGSDENSGMEIALFKITDRKPQSASFPGATAVSDPNIANGINYDNWRISGTRRLNKKKERVLKFGSKTELRDGILEFDIVAVKELNECAIQLQPGCGSIKLFKQILVSPKSSDFFADSGDSGALVFLDEGKTGNTCIGIVEGGISNGTEGFKNGSVIVTPILPILEELNVACLKDFETDISKLKSSVQAEFQNVNSKLKALEEGNQNVQTMIEKLLRKFSDSPNTGASSEMAHQENS